MYYLDNAVDLMVLENYSLLRYIATEKGGKNFKIIKYTPIIQVISFE